VVGAAGLSAACGGGGQGRDYVAVGPAGEAPSGAAGAGPTGEVRLIPLDGPAASRSPADGSGPPAAEGASTPGAVGGSASAAATPTAAAIPSREAAATPAGPSAGDSSTPQASSRPPGPADLSTSEPVRTPTDRRWCEEVGLTFRNSGGTAVRAGTVTFGTHVVDALGIDWATVESTEQLPTPIAPGSVQERTWTVCVDSWRVPPGTRIETRDVSVRWE
jgi:hypothetical protein